MKKLLFLILVIFIGLTCQPVQADKPDVTEVDEIQLRDPLELERAVMQYMLAFEAYTTARRSKDPKVRSRLVKLMQEYRNAYARFLEMLREDKLYRPNRPKDPAGWYDEKHKKTKGYKREWKKTDAKEIRAEVKEMVKNGASPEEIKAFIEAKLPTAPMSADPGLYSTTTAVTSSSSSSSTTSAGPIPPPPPPPPPVTVPIPLPEPDGTDAASKDGDKEIDSEDTDEEDGEDGEDGED
ncbi:MAG: hypothetical protein GQF41_4197 [Candidatus Rifleibacterium amylolyticum]|nr:MAG: hypothetical protein GQF41_4197 [Candidatus Rifleibacterium amylolyticum]